MKAFVYGTLKRGYGANSMLANSVYVGPAVTEDTFVMKSSGFPMIFFNPDGHKVIGEVYEISEDTQKVLDSYEGYPSFYDRKEVSIRLEDDSSDTAWVYYIPDDEDHYNDMYKDKPNDAGYLDWERR